MNPTQLAGLVKRIYPKFNMTQFDDRLKLQKFIYLMQSCELNLGYKFRLYLCGPYSTQLARDGFDIPDISSCSELKFEDTRTEEVFESLIEFLQDKKDDPEVMEILGSLLLFRHLFPHKNEEELINQVVEKSPIFSDKEKNIKILLLKLKQFNRVKW